VAQLSISALTSGERSLSVASVSERSTVDDCSSGGAPLARMVSITQIRAASVLGRPSERSRAATLSLFFDGLMVETLFAIGGARLA